MFTIVVPLVAIGSLIAVAVAIRGFANRRGNFELATRAQHSAVLVATLQLGALVVVTQAVPGMRSAAGLAIVIIGGVIAGLVAISNVARLASDARALVDESPPTIPAAQIVTPGLERAK